MTAKKAIPTDTVTRVSIGTFALERLLRNGLLFTGDHREHRSVQSLRLTLTTHSGERWLEVLATDSYGIAKDICKASPHGTEGPDADFLIHRPNVEVILLLLKQQYRYGNDDLCSLSYEHGGVVTFEGTEGKHEFVVGESFPHRAIEMFEELKGFDTSTAALRRSFNPQLFTRLAKVVTGDERFKAKRADAYNPAQMQMLKGAWGGTKGKTAPIRVTVEPTFQAFLMPVRMGDEDA